MTFKERLGKELLFFDGAMGTALQDKGLTAGELPELWNITQEEIIYDIHEAYLKSGCDILKTNTFGANRLKLQDTEYTVSQIISAAVKIAKKAVQENSGEAYVAFDLGPTGKLLAPFGDLDFEAAYEIFSEMVIAGTKSGADIILIETMSDLYEIKAALLAAKENSNLPVIVTFTLDDAGKLLTGGDILTAVCLIESLGADALGLNCGLGPNQMKKLLPELTRYCSLPIAINPNAGVPTILNGKTVFDVDPDRFAGDMAELAAGGAHVIGGCCGTTPAHIAKMIQKCRGIVVKPPIIKSFTAVSSYSKTVVFGDGTVIIGERLNPTGKPRMKQALRENDMEYLYNEGLEQINNGATILDVNVGLPGIDEPAVLQSAVTGLQSITGTPLQIDTADTKAMERALRLYNGKPLLNSVCGKEESLHTVLPLVKKYGAAVVGLTLDENGIPETAQGRIEIAEKIIKAAERYGIHKKDIIIDTLTMTISTGQKNAKTTLDAMDYIRNSLGVHTVLGVSNVSFGLPEREHINASFFTQAMSRGLSAGIVNPLSPAMMNAYYACQALSGVDINCSRYVEKFALKSSPSIKKPVTEMSLFDAIVSGLREKAGVCAHDLVQEISPLEVINRHLVPALDEVGRGFEQNLVFLPQLLMSAEAAKAAFESIKLHMLRQGGVQEKKGKIILATVKGDIHDIGKNIIKVLLENYNFNVIDLGKNVEPTLIAETALKEKVKLIGLSALMTTTVVNMEETIRILREMVPGCKVMVGGAVLTQEYADKIGADFYSKDAMGSVHYAEKVFTH